MKKIQERFGDPIGSYAGDAPVGVRSVEEAEDAGPCEACGLLPIDGECGCLHGSSSCSGCGNPPENCACSVAKPGVYEGVEPCEECGMLEVGGVCGCTHMAESSEDDLEEVTPPGHEKMVKGLKKVPGIKSPWAVAWAHHKKYGAPKKGKK